MAPNWEVYYYACKSFNFIWYVHMSIILNTAWQAEELWWTSSVFVDKNLSLTVLGIFNLGLLFGFL
jgi:hypothetical protein